MTRNDRPNLTDALLRAHMEAHDLLDALAAKVDGIDPDTANWGHVGDLGYIIKQLRDALGESE